MKTRIDFVSNSSSCSFIVIASSGKLCDVANAKKCSEKHFLYSIPSKEYGCLEFGWQDEMYNSLEDKLNWCGIVLLELYAACRSIEMKAGILGKKAAEVNSKYTSYRDKYVQWKNMLEKVCKERLGIGIYVNLDWINLFGGEDLDSYAYAGLFGCCIDHQSSIFEKPANGKMFETEDALYNFLAYEESYIQCGNDNG